MRLQFVRHRIGVFLSILFGYACYYLTRNSLTFTAPVMVCICHLGAVSERSARPRVQSGRGKHSVPLTASSRTLSPTLWGRDLVITAAAGSFLIRRLPLRRSGSTSRPSDLSPPCSRSSTDAGEREIALIEALDGRRDAGTSLITPHQTILGQQHLGTLDQPT